MDASEAGYAVCLSREGGGRTTVLGPPPVASVNESVAEAAVPHLTPTPHTMTLSKKNSISGGNTGKAKLIAAALAAHGT